MKTMKKILSFFLVAVFLTTASVFPVSAHAASQTTVNEVEAWRTQRFDELSEQHKAIVLQELSDLGLSTGEIDALIQLERSVNLTKNAGNMPLRAEIGDTRTTTITISKSTLQGMSKYAITLYLISRGIPLNVAYDIADDVADMIANNISFTSITITIQYVYGYNNDGVLDWIVGPITWSINY